jgi:hypothetical protein
VTMDAQFFFALLRDGMEAIKFEYR